MKKEDWELKQITGGRKHKKWNRIFETNKLEKPHASLRVKGKIVPTREKCIKCGKKVKFHHLYCVACHVKLKETK